MLSAVPISCSGRPGGLGPPFGLCLFCDLIESLPYSPLEVLTSTRFDDPDNQGAYGMLIYSSPPRIASLSTQRSSSSILMNKIPA